MGAQSSVQLPDTNVEQRGVADPSQIGQEKQNRGAARRQSEHHERDDSQPEREVITIARPICCAPNIANDRAPLNTSCTIHAASAAPIPAARQTSHPATAMST